MINSIVDVIDDKGGASINNNNEMPIKKLKV